MNFAEKMRQAGQGGTELFFMGQAGFILKSAGGQTLGIDLYLSDYVERMEGSLGFKRLIPPPAAPEELQLDFLVATHYHWDHFDADSMTALMANGKTRLFAAWDCRDDVTRLGLPQERIVFAAPGDTTACGDFQLTFLPCDHGAAAPKAIGVLARVDGKTICETGDTCLRLDWADDLPRPLDVLIAPINGAYGNMNEEECVALSRRVRPRLTVPCHFGMFALHGGQPGKYWKLAQEAGTPCLLMAPGEGYRLP